MVSTEILWHSLKINKILERLKTDPNGLTTAQAEERLKKYGPNQLPEEKPLAGLKILFSQFKSPLVYVLLAAAIIAISLTDFVDAAIILVALAINVILGFYQENKANQAIHQLKKMVDLLAKVSRDNREITISNIKLVPGDIIVLAAGDKIPADARLLKADNFQVVEATLTGESVPAEKNIANLEPGAVLADRKNMVFAGTIVARGRAKAVVCATGTKTEIGKISQLVQAVKESPTPLQLQISQLSKTITKVIIALVVLIIIIGALEGRPIISFGLEARESMLLIATAIAVSAIPEGLVITITAILSIGMQAILKRKALVRKLIAAETLGSVSIICTDKTGTLTTGLMEVERIITSSEEVIIKKLPPFQSTGTLKDHDLITKISLLCNNAEIENPEAQLEDWKVIGDPTERALILAALKNGVTKSQLAKNQPRLAEIPFDSENKFMATLNRLDGKRNVIYVKGAPEIIIQMSNQLRDQGKKEKLTQAKKESLEKKYQKLTSQGLRLLALAYKQVDNQKPIANLEAELNQLIFLGFVALKDPLRPEAKATFKLAQKAGIRPIIITGDHKLTAKAIVAELGLNIKEENILVGHQLDKISDDQLQKIVQKIDIYARVQPHHKLRIIAAWQARGEVVAMTGDGVNDAPALKAADIGVALGSGTDVAKETADIILLDDNFKTIVAAVERGRVIFDNIRKTVLYLLFDSFAEIILISGALILKLPLPILVAQILWVNMIDDGLPALALTFEPGEGGIMEQKPRPKKQAILNQEIKTLIFMVGLVSNIIILGLFYWLYRGQVYELNHIRSLIFTLLAIDSLFYVFSARSLRHSIFSKNPLTNKFLVGAVLIGFGLQIIAIYQPFFQKVLSTVALDFTDWLFLIGLGLMQILIIETIKHYFIIKKPA